ncbi:hypothetical protein [Blautia stercoris]|uniref:Uncharacterized protein n=1 Tax=Blautia stercoris TaxID=871664 RepID=A0ABR7PEG6_9FIRM|nr:hypothetical protein [Blautia stercoris]MBC8629206.1 hypothetical protein [Blautia stercoris]
MSKKKSLQTTLSIWAYTNRKMGKQAARIMKAAMEAEKSLQYLKKKR